MSRRAFAGRIVIVLMVAGIAAAVAPLRAQQPQPAQSAQGEFVPVKDLPQQEQLPAARFVVAAYAFVWVALLVYVWALWRRVGSVQREIIELRRRVEHKA